MISEADAVVVGAGAFGLSPAFHLARLGVRRVALVDRFAPASQTSPRAAGLFKLLQADETRTRLARLSIQKVTGFREETGVPLEVVRSGSLMIARTPEHAAFVLEEARQSQAWGVDIQLVDGDEAHRLMPFLEAQGIRAACYTPDDVYIEEPSSLLQAYLEACRRQGVTLVPDTPVTGIRVNRGRVEGVVTRAGEIRTPIVVDAAVARQVPALRGAAVREPRGGLFTMTSDGTFLVGPAPDVLGFWSATGCNGSGFSFSPAIGQVLAEWITAGTPSIDLRALQPARFALTSLDDEQLRAAAVWQYAHYYDPAPARPGLV